MNKIFLFFAIVFITPVFSQYEIQYNYNINSGENSDGEISSGINIKCYLYSNSKQSKFVKNRVFNGKKECEYVNSTPEMLAYLNSKQNLVIGDSIGEVVIKNYANDSIACRYLNKTDVYTKVIEFNNLNIDLINEFKTILNYKCQKAIIKEQNRTFIVWFTNEIPINDGPWKLKGVPGLILHAYSEDTTHIFKVTSISKTKDFEVDFFNFPYDEIVSKETFTKKYLEHTEKSFKYRKSKIKEGGSIKITVNNLDLPKTNFE